MLSALKEFIRVVIAILDVIVLVTVILLVGCWHIIKEANVDRHPEQVDSGETGSGDTTEQFWSE